jgi:hypothetical protein
MTASERLVRPAARHRSGSIRIERVETFWDEMTVTREREERALARGGPRRPRSRRVGMFGLPGPRRGAASKLSLAFQEAPAALAPCCSRLSACGRAKRPSQETDGELRLRLLPGRPESHRNFGAGASRPESESPGLGRQGELEADKGRRMGQIFGARRRSGRGPDLPSALCKTEVQVRAVWGAGGFVPSPPSDT